MKKIYFLIFLLPLLLLNLPAQDSFYYTFHKKKALEVNRSSFSVILKDRLSWQKFVRHQHPKIKEIHGRKSTTERIIFELKEESIQSLDELAQEFFLNPAVIKDLQWGFNINPRLTVWLTDNLLFEPSDSWDERKIEEILHNYPGAQIKQNEFGLFSIHVSDLQHSLDLSNELVEKGMANWAQPDFMGGLQLFHTPGDPMYDTQYPFHNTGQSIDGNKGTSDIDINAEEAWDLSMGSSTIKVGVLDEGVEPHEDLVDDMEISRLLPGYSAEGLGTGESQFQFEGHGQSVAGLIAATHNSLGIAGVAPNVKIVSAYVTADLTSIVSNITNSFSWLAYTAEVDIINNSYGFKSCDPNLYPAIVSIIEDVQINGRDGKGCVVIFASGENDAVNTCVNFPGNNTNVITVGSVDSDGTVPYYSPFGPQVDLVVPSSGDSTDIRSIDRMDTATEYEDRIGLSTGNYVEFFGGTSSSCAIASGVAALILSEDPNLNCLDVEIIMNTTAMSLGSPGFNDSTGNGLLRADAAVSLAMGGFPVEWLDFKAELINDVVRLEWITANEQNNARFDIQRSVGGEFVDLGSLPGAGTTTELNTYDYTDNDPVLGSNYYRIKQIDQNGSFSYSAVIELSRDRVNSLSMTHVYPNPGFDLINLDYALPRGISATYQIVDIQGRILMQNQLEAGEGIRSLQLSITDLSPGIYNLVMNSSKGNIRSKRFIIKR